MFFFLFIPLSATSRIPPALFLPPLHPPPPPSPFFCFPAKEARIGIKGYGWREVFYPLSVASSSFPLGNVKCTVWSPETVYLPLNSDHLIKLRMTSARYFDAFSLVVTCGHSCVLLDSIETTDHLYLSDTYINLYPANEKLPKSACSSGQHDTGSLT